MKRKKCRIKITADAGTSFTVMFEPSGMTYDLAESAYMFAEVEQSDMTELEIVYWQGGISLWPPGPVTTFDASGTELHRL